MLATTHPVNAFQSQNTDAQLVELARSRAWLKLGHFEKNWWGRWRGDGGSSPFYLAENGLNDPLAELRATYTAFAQWAEHPEAADVAAPCRFPARFHWLKRELSEVRWPAPQCPQFDRWKMLLDAHGVSLVFSSYFLGNPSSTFGHTFLRIHRQPLKSTVKASDLLDYGFNFSATVDTNNAFVYGFKGLMGGFYGSFSNTPYYFKVAEYNDTESRDLWEYRLHLSQDEVEQVVAHFWELGQSRFSYYYLSKNCSYYVLTALEAASPRLHLVDQLPAWVIPVDTIKAVEQVPGLVASRHYRPSKRSTFVARLERLTAKQKRLLRELKTSTNALDQEPTSQAKAQVLDAAIDGFDYEHFRDLMANDPKALQAKHELLSLRASLGPSAELVLPTPEIEAPEKSHPSQRFSVSALQLSGQRYGVLLNQRFAIHDFLDNRQGYPRDARVGVMDVGVRVLATEANATPTSADLDHFYLVNIESLSPWQRFLPSFSWAARLGMERAYDNACGDCLTAASGGSVGYTAALNVSETFLVSALLDGELSTSESYDNRWKLATGPQLLVRWLASPLIAVQTSARYHRLLWVEPVDTTQLNAELRLRLHPRWSMAIQSLSEGRHWEHRLTLHRYF